MEVHHHPKLEKKNFKEYFLEFIMIFLAVTLGFLAENIREHFVDKNHEREYISSLYEDLSTDEAQLSDLMNRIQVQQLHAARSLPLLFKSMNTTTPANEIYFLLRAITRQQGIQAFINDRTITQLKNSGQMRLISNKEISNTLIAYYKKVEFVEYLQEGSANLKTRLRDKLPLILNNEDYDLTSDSNDKLVNPPNKLYLRSTEADAINEILMIVSGIRGVSTAIENRILGIKNDATDLKKQIA